MEIQNYKEGVVFRDRYWILRVRDHCCGKYS